MTNDSKEHSHSSNYEPISLSVIQKVANTVNKPPEQLTPTLSEIVDLGALNRLFQSCQDGSAQMNGQTTFTWIGCRVIVKSTGDVEVSPIESESQAACSGGKTAE
ncbi:HalOD1 output domain-containing protein [Haloarcula amylovorans]|uniref:HalOD1 output domain-containing protein n=1 Tax=Haloarcula amylovorans TaxID=2562280 RepID=UPI001431BDD4